jgi:hypothetical protein
LGENTAIDVAGTEEVEELLRRHLESDDYEDCVDLV